MITLSELRQKQRSAASSKERKYEKEIDLQTSGSVRGKEPQHLGNRVVRTLRVECGGFNLAICAANEFVAFAANWNRDRATHRPPNCLVKGGPFDNE
jgi:hypothetical protein